MALSKTTYGVVATPRVYVDNLLLARTLGLKFNLGALRFKIDGIEEAFNYYGGSLESIRMAWDLDPVRYVTLAYPVGAEKVTSVGAECYVASGDRPFLRGFLNLMHTSNYAAVLNHNFFSGSEGNVIVSLNSNAGAPTSTGIVGDFNQDIDEDGFIIAGITLSDEQDELWEFDFNIEPSDGLYLSEGFSFNIGSFSVGTYLDFPVSPDLSVKTGYVHDGVKTKRSIAGKDLTHVSYSGSPDWGRLPPFTTSRGSDMYFRGAGMNGRKTWDLKFSYIDKTDMFVADWAGNSAGGYLRDDNDNAIFHGFKEEQSILGTYLSRTLGGKLKHIFQPDNTKAEFYMVKLDQGSTKITQVAHGVFEVSFKFVQVW